MIPSNIIQVLNVLCPKMNTQGMQNVNNPDDMAQYLLNTGVVSQEQVNKAKQLWEKPDIRQMVQSKFKF